MLMLLFCFLSVSFVALAATENINEADRHWWVALIIFGALLLAFIAPLVCRQLCSAASKNGSRPTSRGVARVAQLARYRLASCQSHLNEVPPAIPPSGRYIAEIRDRNEKALANYELLFTSDGKVKGSARIQHKSFVVDGFFHAAKSMYIWGETDNSARIDPADDPLLTERKLISQRVHHTEVEATIRDAARGHLFIVFSNSCGLQGRCHCHYCPVGRLSGEPML